MKKILKIVAIIVVSVLLVAYLVLMFATGTIVRNVAKSYAPKYLGCDVHIEDVSISWLLNGVTVTGVKVGNPEGFKTDSSFKLDSFVFDLDAMSVFTDTIVVNKVIIDGAKVTYEQGLTSTNLGTIYENLKSATAPTAEVPIHPTPEEAEEKEVATSGGKKVIIKLFEFKNAEASLSATLLGGSEVSIPMANIKLENIGEGSDGASLAEVASEMYNEVLGGVTKVMSISGDGFNKAGDSIKKGAGDAGDAIKKGVNSLLDSFK